MSNQEIRLPDERDRKIATISSRSFARHIDKKDGISVQIAEDGTESVVLPRQIVRFLVDVLTQMSEGNAVTILPVGKELTTQEAAGILNVSRPHLIKLLNEGTIKFHKTGTHRRILFEDLMDFKKQRDRDAEKAADDLAALSQELGLEY
jgi:excisionase family DNA binding protein